MSLEGRQLGQYLLLRLLGHGGMSEVYSARDNRIGQIVAIKVARIDSSLREASFSTIPVIPNLIAEGSSPFPPSNITTLEEAVRFLRHEAEVLARLNHPFILPLFTYEESGNATVPAYIVLPCLEEGSFDVWLQQREKVKQISLQDTALLLHQMADALQHVHEHQIIHQDIKPANFLIRSKKKAGLPDVLLFDFGIARFSARSSHRQPLIQGTGDYMPPEQWMGVPVLASDQYALAIGVYRMVTGRMPFKGETLLALKEQHLYKQPQAPSIFNSNISHEVNMVLLKALAKQPEARYSTVTDFADAFQMAVDSGNNWILPPPKEKIHVFISYAQKDQLLWDQLENHLSMLKRLGNIDTWDTRRIGAGQQQTLELDLALDTADIILLLLSADFLAADQIWNNEVRHAMQKRQKKEAHIILILLRPVDQKGAPFENLQMLPRNRKPVTLWKIRDEAFYEIAIALRETIEELYPYRKPQEISSDPVIESPTMANAASATQSHSQTVNSAITTSGESTQNDIVQNIPENKTAYERYYQEVLYAYERVLHTTPNDPLIYFAIGNVYKALGRYKQALARYEQSLFYDPLQSNVYAAQGNILYKLQLFNDAIRSYKNALKIEPRNPLFHYSCWIILHKQKKYRNARVARKLAIRLNPKIADIYKDWEYTLM